MNPNPSRLALAGWFAAGIASGAVIFGALFAAILAALSDDETDPWP